MMNSVTMSCVEIAGFGGCTNAGQFAMAARNSRAKWQLLQHNVNQHTAIRKKLLNVIDEAVHRIQAGGTKCDIRLAVETVNTITSKSSTAPDQCINVFEFATHSSPTVDQLNQKGQTLSSGEDLSIKVPGLPLDPVALATLLLSFISIQIFKEILEEDSPEKAIPEIVIFIIVLVLEIVQQVEGTNHLGPNLQRDGMQMSFNKQVLSICSIGLMSFSGAHSADSTEGINQSRKAAEKHDSFMLTPALTLAAITIGSAAVWRISRKRAQRRAIPDFGVIDEVLRDIPIPRRSNQDCLIHPTL